VEPIVIIKVKMIHQITMAIPHVSRGNVFNGCSPDLGK